MALDVRGVSFGDIEQDGIKLDNDNGVIDVQIGGATVAEGNVFDVGFRGIQIQTDEDPALGRTNRILMIGVMRIMILAIVNTVIFSARAQ